MQRAPGHSLYEMLANPCEKSLCHFGKVDLPIQEVQPSCTSFACLSLRALIQEVLILFAYFFVFWLRFAMDFCGLGLLHDTNAKGMENWP